MIKVLIVDDELLVRIGLVSTIDWEKNGFEVIGQAKNGKEAIQIFENTNPDIVITDIGMPGMNGLELLSYLKNIKPSLKSIILTHHSDFDFAREAIQLGVTQYLLKSELNENNLLAILKELSQNLNLPASNNYFLSKTEENLFITCLENNTMDSCPSLLTEKLYQRFPNEYYSIVFTRIFNIAKEDMPNMDEHQVKKILQNLLSQNTTGNALRYIALPKKNTLILVLNYHLNQYEHMENHLLNVSHHLNKFLNLNTTFGISSPSINFQALPKLLEEAIVAEHRSFFSQRGIFFYQNLDTIETSDILLDINGLKKMIANEASQNVINYLERLLSQIHRRKDYEQCHSVFVQLIAFSKEIQQMYHFDTIDDDTLNFEIFSTFHEMKDYLILYYQALQKKVSDINANSHSFIVNKSLEYIESHYNEPISLGNIAEQLQISTSYLSHIFKQEMLINFSTYLNQFRIEKSKKLLTNSSLKVYEIASLVGFENPYYFSKVFKEFTKMTCKEFRNQ